MREETAATSLQDGNINHLLLLEDEIENVQVFTSPFQKHALRQRPDAPQDQPAQYHLAHRFLMLQSNRCQHLVLEQVALALGERLPYSGMHTVVTYQARRF